MAKNKKPGLSEADAKMAGLLTYEVTRAHPLVREWVHNLMKEYDEKAAEIERLEGIISDLKREE